MAEDRKKMDGLLENVMMQKAEATIAADQEMIFKMVRRITGSVPRRGVTVVPTRSGVHERCTSIRVVSHRASTRFRCESGYRAAMRRSIAS